MNPWYRRLGFISCLLLVLWFFPFVISAQTSDGRVAPLPSEMTEAMVAQKIESYQSDLSAPAELLELTTTSPRTPDDMDPYEAMAFQSGRNGNWDIYLATGGSANLTRLTTSTRQDLRPQIRRGADMIVFSRVASDTNYEIYRVNADGSGETRLTETEAMDHYPTWSPNGAWIYFASTRTGNYELFRMDNQWQLRSTTYQ